MATLPTKFFDKPGHQMVGGSWSSASYRSVDRSSFAIIPGQGVAAGTETGSWALFYAFDQAIWIDPCNPKRSWGLFGNAGLADGNPNPIQWSFVLGVGGNSMIPRRTYDTFGAAFYFVNLSDDFKNLLGGPVLAQKFAQHNEHGVELFYNFAVTRWCQLTTDLQFIDPSTKQFNNAVVPGLRLKIDF
jgi:porin